MTRALPAFMRPSFLFVFALAASFSLVGVGAHADPCEASTSPCVGATAIRPSNRWDDRPFTVAGVIGVGTPVGMTGTIVEWAPVPMLVLGVGLGASTRGAQYSAMIRLRGVEEDGPAGAYFGVGASAGHYEWSSNGFFGPDSCIVDCSNNPWFRKTWSTAYWGNAEIGIEGRARNGFSWRGFVGIAGLLNPDAYACSGFGKACAPSEPGNVLFYFGTAWGYSF